ncbi:alpha/beta hydrolase [Oceanivirga miroungae]|uniref:2-succinyl-6-hydroxy-2, 4-cyclohexadiene-1-carboxylate synthase n=1 Tax=Oceanivirga miroungae TaxID=1130046 RepID=A0A6I8MDG7_9FUSO|nr:alpha/beta hydrolase [Oceanivirga miroungae]VWL85555.1 2-succinyl-6-hydroxy-2, 4-cyclohexadiene-1-carboxylate synthase [Oceanivirga miroungae]
MKNKKLKILLTTITIILLGSVFAANHLYNVALNVNTKTSVREQDVEKDIEDTKYEENYEWLKKQNVKERKIKSVLNKDIYAYELRNKEANKWIITVHGYSRNGHAMATFIRHFYDLGYNVLFPDLLGHGKSKNDFYTMGSYDSKDLAKWVKLISSENKESKIILFGVSMGAATVLNSLDENLTKNVVAFIEDSGYISLDKLYTYQLKKNYKLSKFPLLNLASTITKIRAGFYFKDVDAKKALEDNKIPGLFLHGEKDTFVPIDNLNEMIKYGNFKKEVHTFKDVKHVKAYFVYEKEYWDIISKFLKKVE